jgi:GntR family transcriptional regulator, carbon starvation induced regulator
MLRAAIFAGRFPAGAPLRFQEIQALCGMSASPVREALARLAGEGLVEGEHNHGYRVVRLTREELDDLVRTRTLLETWMLTRSIERGDDHWEAGLVAALHMLLRRPRKAAQDPRLMNEEWNDRHAALHAALMAGCDSAIQQQFCRQLYDRADLYRRLSLAVETEPRDIDSEHREIVEAAIARDAPRATRLLAEHYEETANFLRRTMSRRS